MTTKAREEYIRQVLEEYFDGDDCIGDMLASKSSLPEDMTIEDAVYIYARLMYTVENDRLIRSNEEQGWQEDVTDWFDVNKGRTLLPNRQWHDVKDELPEPCETEAYLIYNGKVQFALYLRDYGWTPIRIFDKDGNRLVFADVKYWMTIPEHPGKEQ